MTIKPQQPVQAQIKSVIALYSNDQIHEALDTVEILIKDYPNEALLFNISGACYQAIGQLNKAVKSFEKAVTFKPDYAEAHYNLGVVFKKLGQLDNAIKCYQEALAINPQYADAHNNFGNALQELGQLDEAVKCYKKALAYKPEYAEAHHNLGIVLVELGQLDNAIKCYQEALAINPQYADAHNNFGNALQELGQLDEAVKCYKKALAYKPEYAEAHHNLGIVLVELGQLDNAIKCYQEALAINPQYADAHNSFGNALQELGQLDEAVKCYEKALAYKPEYTEALLNLSGIKKYTANDPQISIMQSLYSRSDLNLSNRIHLCFALAKVNEDLGEQDELFEFLHEGNRLRKQELNYSLNSSQNQSSTVKKMFSSPPSLSYEPSTIRPVFIVGMPRSGTTLVEQIIASHHAVHGAGELNNLSKFISPILKSHYTKNKSSLNEKDLLTMRKQYLDLLSSFKVPENVITDKMPLNFRFIGFILSAIPEAKIVHLKRDARATCWSIYKYYFGNKGNGFSYNLDDLAGFYGLYADLMDFWHQSFPDQIYDLCYEDLTTNQKEETRKLLEYCELDWDENCLNFHTSKRVVKTASALQVRQKMYQGSSEAWKKHKAYLQPLIKALSSY